jgi:phosphate transport system substrate-binding protein
MRRSFIKTLIAGGMLAIGMNTAMAADITGAGATFPYPIYAKWAEVYKKLTNVGLNYQSIGSSGGKRQIAAKTVTFGATDAPLKAEELDKEGLVQFPAVLGGVVTVVNLDGFKPNEIRITGPVLADVYLGNITKWNDPKILALNPNKVLPALDITVVHRADGSGTTNIFTDYLSTVSKNWADKVGKGSSVKWPADSSLGGKGNEGVAANVTRVKGAIGYVEYAYAKKNNVPYLQIQNKDGNFVSPSSESFAAAAAGADWFKVPGMGISLVDQPGAMSWPITAGTFILMYKNPTNIADSNQALKFFKWSFKDGKQLALDLDYVPLPDVLTSAIESKVWSQIKQK